MSKSDQIEPAEIPPHMIENPTSRAQKKAFGKVKRAQKADAPAKKSTAKKAAKKSAASTEDSGYGMGAGKDEKP